MPHMARLARHDRMALKDQEKVARVYEMEHGPQTGHAFVTY